MARNFQNMTKEELSLIITEADFAEFTSADLRALNRAAKEAGILTEQFANIIGLASNNKVYEEIKNDKNSSEEDKAVALAARNEYNRKLRQGMKNKYYNAEEILSMAVIQNGKYFFPDKITKGEMDFLVESGALRLSDFGASKDYKVGQEKESNLEAIKKAIAQDAEKRALLAQLLPSLAENAAKREAAAAQAKTPKKETKAETSAMPADLQKSYDFWNKFNEKSEKNGVKFDIENVSNRSLIVEAKKDGKTMFKGIDHGTKGFDIVKRDKSAEPYEIFDLLVKKAKASNPKTKIRIKDNVKDEVLRNKILIACAKNNMMPVGNLPEGFDFEELKALVKDAKTTEDINELASNLYQPQEFGIGAEKEDDKGRNFVAPVILPGKETKKEEESKPVVAPVVIPAQNKSEKDNGRRGGAVVAPIVPSNGGNGGSNIPPSNNDKEKKKSGGAWSRFWNKAKVWVMAGIVAAAGLFGIKSCQNNQDKMADKIEQISNKSALDCDAVQSLIDEKYNDGYMDGLQAGKEDCEKSKQKPVVKKKPVKRKVTPVKPAPVILPGDTIKGETVYIPGDTIKGEPVYVPGDTIKGKPVYVPGDTIPVKPKVKPSSVPLEEIDGSIKHEKDYDLNDAKDLDAKGNAVSSKKKGKTSSEGATVNFMDLYNLTKNQKVN